MFRYSKVAERVEKKGERMMSKLKLSLMIVSLILSSNSYGAYINHHYDERVEEKFVSEYIINSDTVVACYVKYKDFFAMENPSLKDTLNECKENKRIIEKLNKTKYKFGKVKGYVPYSREVIVELIEVEK